MHIEKKAKEDQDLKKNVEQKEKAPKEIKEKDYEEDQWEEPQDNYYKKKNKPNYNTSSHTRPHAKAELLSDH